METVKVYIKTEEPDSADVATQPAQLFSEGAPFLETVKSER